MKGWSLAKKILLIEAAGTALTILFLWLDEMFDLPHRLFGVAATPSNLRESLFESVVVLMLGGAAMVGTFLLARRLQRSNSEKDRLLGVISHDLRNQFSQLLLGAEALTDRSAPLSEEERAELAEGVQDSARSTFGLLENLLEWARIQLEGTEITPVRCDLKALTGSAMAQLAPVAGAKDVYLTSHVEEGTWILADETVMHSVLQNLLHNAVKFSHQGGRVEVTARARGRMVEVKVLDRGVGIGKAQVRALARKGWCSSSEGTAGEKGSGLGLMLVKELVTRSGGKLRVKGEAGKGTTVTLTLPKGPAEPLPEEP